jgi:DNA-binding NarL/FixJ family response regulator
MRILLADDHKLLRAGLVPLLEKLSPEAQVIEADDLPQAIAAVEAIGGVDLALLDLRMPGMNGLTGLVSFIDRFPGTLVVLLSAFGDPDTVLSAIRAGAAGFIPKTIGGRGFTSALHLILAGEVYVPGTTLLEVGEHMRSSPPPQDPPPVATPNEPLDARLTGLEFSAREREIMRLLVEGLPNKLIATRLGLHEPTVKACLRGLYQKIAASNRAHAVKIILDIQGRLH